MDNSSWLLLLDVLLWAALFLVASLRLSASPLSNFELNRRAESGDDAARKDAQRDALLPRTRALQSLVGSLLLVLAIATAVTALGWLLGALLSMLVLVLLLPSLRLARVAAISTKLYGKYEDTLQHFIEGQSWLEYLRMSDPETSDYVAQSKAELSYVVERSAGVMSKSELLRLRASLAFDTHVVEDIMTPISVVDLANVHDALGPLVLDDLHKTGHSRFPVIDEDIHHVVGILYLHDIINLKSAKPTVREAMDPRVHYIHENQSLEHALNGFLKSHRHLFVVVNDYRETVGVLALEDVLETLLGKTIVDEFDQYEDLRAVAESNPRKNNLPKGKTDI